MKTTKTMNSFTAYFHRVAPRNLEKVINRIAQNSPPVRHKISAVAAISEDKGVAYFIVEVFCEERISEQTAEGFRHLQHSLAREGLIHNV